MTRMLNKIMASTSSQLGRMSRQMARAPKRRTLPFSRIKAIVVEREMKKKRGCCCFFRGRWSHVWQITKLLIARGETKNKQKNKIRWCL